MKLAKCTLHEAIPYGQQGNSRDLLAKFGPVVWDEETGVVTAQFKKHLTQKANFVVVPLANVMFMVPLEEVEAPPAPAPEAPAPEAKPKK